MRNVHDLDVSNDNDKVLVKINLGRKAFLFLFAIFAALSFTIPYALTVFSGLEFINY